MGKISRRSYKEELKQPIIKEWVANKHLEFMFTELDPATEHDLRVFVKDTGESSCMPQWCQPKLEMECPLPQTT